MSSLIDALDLFDLALGRARGVVPQDALEAAQTSAQRIRDRRGFLGDVLVVAIAGGTGSGKSSLLNAMAGKAVASVSSLRPHTDVPLAWIPASSEVAIAPLLDALGIDERVENASLPGFAVIDLPDTDSIADWHRTIVERLLPAVDAVVWVFDPVKYHDPVLHDRFLEPLSRYDRQFVFVLNQIDRVPEGERALLEAHLRGCLEEDGYERPTVVAVAADPTGPPQGIDEFREFLNERLDAKTSAVSKLAEDIRGAAVALAAPEGLWRGSASELNGVTDPVEMVRTTAGGVGTKIAQRLYRALELEGADQQRAAVLDALWDRSYLGATLASVGVATAEVMSSLEVER